MNVIQCIFGGGISHRVICIPKTTSPPHQNLIEFLIKVGVGRPNHMFYTTDLRPNTLLMKEDGGWSGGNDVEGALVVRRMTHHVIRPRPLGC